MNRIKKIALKEGAQQGNPFPKDLSKTSRLTRRMTKVDYTDWRENPDGYKQTSPMVITMLDGQVKRKDQRKPNKTAKGTLRDRWEMGGKSTKGLSKRSETLPMRARTQPSS